MGLRERLLELVGKGHQVEEIDPERVAVDDVTVYTGEESSNKRLDDVYERREGGISKPFRGNRRSLNRGRGFDARDRAKKKGAGGHVSNPQVDRGRN